LLILGFKGLLDTIYSILNYFLLNLAEFDHFVKILYIKQLLFTFLSIFSKHHLLQVGNVFEISISQPFNQIILYFDLHLQVSYLIFHLHILSPKLNVLFVQQFI